MAEMKFIENKLQSFDIHAQPPVTHTQIEKLKKVSPKRSSSLINDHFQGSG